MPLTYITMSQLEEYAYNMACCNRDELNTMSEQALSFVEEGRINEALSLYANANLTAIYKGINAKISQGREEMNAMLPSLYLNADIYLFAGGEENLQKAEEIYRAIALSDTTNATNMLEYGKFLSERRARMSQAKDWWIRAARYSTDSMQLAELYAGIALAELYDDHMKEASEYLNQSLEIYSDLVNQADLKDNAYLNMSYATTYCITECRYWLKMGKNGEAVLVMSKGVDYANKALQKNPPKYMLPYTIFIHEYATSIHEFFVQIQQKTDENLMLLKEISHNMIDLFNISEPKDRLNMAHWLAGTYLLLATSYSNWGLTDESDAYIDSCSHVLEQYKERNPILFSKTEANLILVKGINLIQNQQYILAANYVYEAYSRLKMLPYAAKSRMQAMHILAIASLGLEEKLALEYSSLALKEMRNSSYSLPKRKMYNIYYAYTYLHAVAGKDLLECEKTLFELIRFIDLNDSKREWITDESLENFFIPIFALYHKNIVSSKEYKSQVIAYAFRLLEKYPDLKEGDTYRMILTEL